jgi:hypothetical protein
MAICPITASSALLWKDKLGFAIYGTIWKKNGKEWKKSLKMAHKGTIQSRPTMAKFFPVLPVLTSFVDKCQVW